MAKKSLPPESDKKIEEPVKHEPTVREKISFRLEIVINNRARALQTYEQVKKNMESLEDQINAFTGAIEQLTLALNEDLD